MMSDTPQLVQAKIEYCSRWYIIKEMLLHPLSIGLSFRKLRNRGHMYKFTSVGIPFVKEKTLALPMIIATTYIALV